MRKIIYAKPDGGVAVVTPIRNTLGDEGLTDAQIELRAWDKLPVDAIDPVFVDPSVIPTDRSKRDKWVKVGASIAILP